MSILDVMFLKSKVPTNSPALSSMIGIYLDHATKYSCAEDGSTSCKDFIITKILFHLNQKIRFTFTDSK